MNMSVRRTVAATEVVDAIPHATPVRSWKAERRYVKEGSARWYVFFVSVCAGSLRQDRFSDTNGHNKGIRFYPVGHVSRALYTRAVKGRGREKELIHGNKSTERLSWAR